METQEEYVSLFEFLGKPAGGALGKEVYSNAKNQKIKMKDRVLQLLDIKGKLCCIPKHF